MGGKLKDVLGVLDPVLAAASVLALPAVYVTSRMRNRTPMARSVFDRAGVSLIPQHYYEPIVREAELYRSLEEPRDLPGLDLNLEGQLAFLSELRFGDDLARLEGRQVAGRSLDMNSANYPTADAEMLYSIVRRTKPRRVVEVGSGSSTLITLAAVEDNRAQDPAYTCQVTCIEPFEQPWLEEAEVEVVRQRVELTDREVFAALEAGDLLFIDSSHVIRPQGDVVVEYLELLPTIADGVLVHVHDIRTPRDYSKDWIVSVRRLWDEQYLLEALLTENPRFEILAAVNMLSKDHPEALAAACPGWGATRDREPSSFWMRRRAAA